MQSCNYRPKVVHVVCELFSSSEFWSKESVNVCILREFLSCVEELQFSVNLEQFSTEEDVPLYSFASSHILEAILSSEKPSLSAGKQKKFSTITILNPGISLLTH